jgi:hypothetical protein
MGVWRVASPRLLWRESRSRCKKTGLHEVQASAAKMGDLLRKMILTACP